MSETKNSGSFKTGLVLSGGGAKGSYQVGVLKALLELDANVDMVSGASIGALNGAVLACAPSLAEGVQRLENLWNTLAGSSPVEARLPTYLKLLAATGLIVGGPLLAPLRAIPWASAALGAGSGFSDLALLSDRPLVKLMDEYLDTKGLAKGLPLYVSVYERGATSGLNEILACIAAETGLVDTRPSQFLLVQSLPEQEQRQALLASAAIPLLYEAQQVGERRYSDGGQGGWQTAQGNTPISPLIEAGCSQVIVTHLADGSVWDRHDFPETTVLEIRPQSRIASDAGLLGSVRDVIGFDSASIKRLMAQGYEDTLHCVGRVQKALQSREALRQSTHVLASSMERGSIADAGLNDIMSSLR